MKITSFTINDSWEDWYVQSKDSEYLIIINLTEDTIYCTCPDFQYRKDKSANLRHGGALLIDNSKHSGDCYG